MSFTHREILQNALEAERQLLEHANQQTVKEFSYYNMRDRLAERVIPLIEKKHKSLDQVQVLEIGGGQGKATLKMAESFRERLVDSVHFSMTSLTRLPEHRILKELGVRLYYGVILEELPKPWTERFDIVCTDSVLGRANKRLAVPELFRILKPGGVWIGLEDTVYYNFNDVPMIIEEQLQKMHIPNEYTQSHINAIRENDTRYPYIYPFQCTKHHHV